MLVAIHEFGHFITAKLSGVKVNEFSIGMGPAIFKKQKGETLYSLRIFPFGGYCAMEGEDKESQDPRAFGSAHILKRILIVVAGSLMNLLMGFLVLLFVFMPVDRWPVPVVDTIVTEEQLEENMLHPGDEIVSVNDYNVYLFQDINIGITRDDGDNLHDIVVIRDGKEKLLSGIQFTQDDSNETKNENEGEKPEASESSEEDNKGYEIEFKTEESSFFGKIKYTAQNGVNLVRLVFVGVGDLVSGSVSKDDISGPIGIGKVMAETAEADMLSLWYLFAFISINLGIMNLLPLPALDGGRLIFLLIELIFRKKVPPKYEAIVHAVGLILLLGLMVLVTFNDVINIF
ncbi:MAG: site-2 protease family protein [Oscillospiraceae bacterium]|nr:site-2 protease family protein [Oscillospiraceae bacterium]